MIWIALVLLVFAAAGSLSATPDRLPAVLLGFYWLASLMGQLFALPLCLLALVCAMFAQGWGIALALLAATGFGCIHWRNRRAARLLLDVVGETEVKLPLHAGLTPFVTGKRKTARLRGISYGPGGKRNLLDVVQSREPRDEPAPVLIHFHGGAWTVGDRDQQAKPLIHHMAARGWVCFDATYSLGPASRGPDWIVDALRAIAWVRAHAAEYGGDPARIALTGESAGAHLAALAALAHDDPLLKPGFEAADCSVRAAVPLYGRYDLLDRDHTLKRNHAAVIDKYMAVKVMPGPVHDCRDLWHALSPLDRVRPDAPPMLIVHGTADTMLPWQDARTFADALRPVSRAPVRFCALPYIQHGWDSAVSALTWGHVRAVAAFLAPLENAGRERG